nr:unnamed protein product [Spirometra erinaceieuropaei]
MHFQSRLSTTTVHELLVADDCALNPTTGGDMQKSMGLLYAACDNFGLIITAEKTAVMHQPPPNTAQNAPQISVNGTQLQVVDNFITITTIILLLLHHQLKVCRCGVCHVHQHYTQSVHTNNTTISTNDEELVITCPHCDHAFTSHIGLAGQQRIHRTEAGESVPGAPTYTRRIRLHCPHMRIHESGIDRSTDTPGPSSTPTMTSPAHTPPPNAPTATSSITVSTSCTPTMLSPTRTIAIAEADTDTTYFSCPHCPRIITSRIAWSVTYESIGQTDEPVPGAPTTLAASASTVHIALTT